MLNKKYYLLLINSLHDDNAYTLNRINNYYIIITYLLKKRYDIAFVVSVTKNMLRNFKFIRIKLIIDIEERVFSDKYNIKLENIVIDYSIKKNNDITLYNFSKAI